MDLVTGEQRPGGDMTTARGDYFRMVVVNDKVLAVGGDDGKEYLTSVEEWLPEVEEWVARKERRDRENERLALAREKDAVCQASLFSKVTF